MRQPVVDTEIAAVRAAKSAQGAAEVATLQAVIAWAAAHRVELGVVTEESFGENGVLLGGIGCPLVSEFGVYDLAATLGMSSEAGCGFVAKTLELRYRLRRTWERVVALDVPVWKAFKVAEATMCLTWEAASYIDRMLAPALHSCSFAQIERTIAMGIDLHDPEEAEKRRKKAADDRCFDIHLNDTATTGTVDLSGTLALEDALDLEAAVRVGAKTLGDLGNEESLDARRAMAVGEMARTQLALDLTGDSDLAAGAGRGVTIYAHVDADGLHASMDNPGAGDVLIEQIKVWCQTVGNVVTVKPVIDLNAEIAADAYTPTAKLVEHVRLRDQCCIFPNCTRRARYCDLDHQIPYNQDDPASGGKTTTGNLALLCRRHHRAKTFSAWAYARPRPGVYEWTSPTGARFRVTRGRNHGRIPIATEIPTESPPGEP